MTHGHIWHKESLLLKVKGILVQLSKTWTGRVLVGGSQPTL